MGRFTGNPIVDAAFQYLFSVEALDLERQHYRRKAFLARYGRQSVLQWDDVEVSEINRHVEALAELIKEENEAARSSEDG